MNNPELTQKYPDCQELSPLEGIITLPQFLQSREREIILNALEKRQWNATKAAKHLGITYRSIRYLMGQLGLVAKIHGDKLRDHPAKPSSIYLAKFKTLRYEVLLRDKSTCQMCGSSPQTGALMHVDHIKPRSKFPELELEISNLQTLCQSCNLSKSDRTDHLEI